MSLSDFFANLFGVRRCESIEALRRYIRRGDVQHLASWIDWRIVYTSDKSPGDEWKPADTSIKDGKGDCEDKAVVAWEVIRSWPGWTAKLFYLRSADGRKAHAVCGAEDPYGRRIAVEGRRPYIYPHKTAWGHIFSDIGGWEKFWEVDTKGRRTDE